MTEPGAVKLTAEDRATAEEGRSSVPLLGAINNWFFAPVDARAYAACRIGYAAATACVLLDLWRLRHTLIGHASMIDNAGGHWVRAPINCFLWVQSSPTGVSLLLGIALLACLLLGLGIGVRLSALVLWVYQVSLGAAVLPAYSGFDAVLRVLAIVVLISPTSSVWTVRARDGERPPTKLPRYGLRLIQWQFLLIYTSTVWLKAPDIFWRSGEAVAYFSMSMFARIPGAHLANWPAVYTFLTWSTLIVEAAIPWLMWKRSTRLLGLVLGLSLHFGISLMSKIGLFAVVMAPMYMAFLEARDFEAISAWLSKSAGLWRRFRISRRDGPNADTD